MSYDGDWGSSSYVPLESAASRDIRSIDLCAVSAYIHPAIDFDADFGSGGFVSSDHVRGAKDSEL